MNKTIGVTIGDVNGIGIDILIETWKQKKFNNFILFTDIRIIKSYFKKKNIKIKINIVNSKYKEINIIKNGFNIFDFKSISYEDNTYKSLKFAYEYTLKKICIGIITLPLRKDLIKENINKNFIGQTEYFQKKDKKKYSNMILYHNKIIISTITTHIEVKKISKFIMNKNFLYNQIYNLNNTLIRDFNIKNPKIIISGLNPHAGENGNLGIEEIKSIIPTVNKLKNKGIKVNGPLSGDTLLIKKNINKYNCFVFMHHDQALIPFKFISQFSGVNYTGNLSIIRTSPDHGTGYDLIGSKNISINSFLNCIKLVKKIHVNRLKNVNS